MSSILGSLHEVDAESLNGVIQQYDQALEDNFTKRGQFEKFRDDYTKLRSRLKTLPDKLEYEAMVPICSKAICPGKLIHTNEILVLLGENTFVECTAKTAAEIITHRLKNVNDTLNRLEKERELYNSWKLEAERQMVETLGDGTIEIVEDYDEATEAEWRQRHRDKVRQYHQDLGRKRAAVLSTSAVNNVGKTEEEEKLWTRLDALELEEEFMEAQAIYEERITEGGAESAKCTVKIRERTRSTKLNLPEFQDNRDAESDKESNSAGSGKKVTFSPENIIHNLTDLNPRDFKKKGKEGQGQGLPNSTTTEVGVGPEVKEEVELYKPSDSSDNGLYDPIFIRFRHEALPSNSNSEDDDLVSSDSDSDSEDADYQIVLSPGDIYEQFGPPSLEAKSVPGADKTPLKSILKPRGEKVSHKDLTTTANVVKKKALCETPSIIEVVTGEVKEREPPPPVPVPNSGPDSRKNEALIYAMFPGLAPHPEPESGDDVESEVIQEVSTNDKDLSSGDVGAGATINLSLNSDTSATNRPLSLFKRMKSKDRALSSDSPNN